MKNLHEQNDSAIAVDAETHKDCDSTPVAGPHARPVLTNNDACPGSGVLPSQTKVDEESDPGAG
jgi:hypothetical protein